MGKRGRPAIRVKGGLCKHGHRLVEGNIIDHQRGVRCLICQLAAQRKHYWAAKGLPVPLVEGHIAAEYRPLHEALARKEAERLVAH